MTESLAERFAANAEAAGFVVHRGEAPEIEGSERSTASYGLADTGQRRAGRRAGRAAGAAPASGGARLRAFRGADPSRPRRALRRRRAPTFRVRSQSSPAPAAAPTSSNGSSSASMALAKCTSSCCRDRRRLPRDPRCRRDRPARRRACPHAAPSSSSTRSRSTAAAVRSTRRARWSGSVWRRRCREGGSRPLRRFHPPAPRRAWRRPPWRFTGSGRADLCDGRPRGLGR